MESHQVEQGKVNDVPNSDKVKEALELEPYEKKMLIIAMIVKLALIFILVPIVTLAILKYLRENRYIES